MSIQSFAPGSELSDIGNLFEDLAENCKKFATVARVSRVPDEGDTSGINDAGHAGTEIRYVLPSGQLCTSSAVIGINPLGLELGETVDVPIQPSALGPAPQMAAAPEDDSIVTAFDLINGGGAVLSATGIVPISAQAFLDIFVTADSGATIYGLLVGLFDDDTSVTGSIAGEEIEVGAGNDTVAAGAGDDTVLKWRPGDLILDGGSGSDTLRFDAAAGDAFPTPIVQQLIVNLATGTGQSPYGGTLSLTSVENVGGTPQADIITGNDQPNIIGFDVDLGGADTIDARGGDDVVNLGPTSAQVSVDGGAGFDEIHFPIAQVGAPAGGNSVLELLSPSSNTGIFASETITGFESFFPFNPTGATQHLTFGATDAAEQVTSPGDSIILMRGGNDTLNGGVGNDSLDGGEGDDLFTVGLGNDTLNGGPGFDTLDLSPLFPGVAIDLGAGTGSGGNRAPLVLSAIEHVIGTVANDTLAGSNGADRLEGGLGNDTLTGGLGNDTLIGSPAVQGAGAQDIDVAVFPGNRASYDIAYANGVALVTGPAGSDTVERVERLQFDDQTVETPPVVTIVDRSISEGDSGTKSLLFSVSLSAVPTTTVTVTATPVDGTALAGVDYNAAATVLTFNPGQRFANFSATILGDTGVEGNETFTVVLSSPVGAILGATTFATATIQDDDGPQSLVGTSAADTLTGGGGNDSLFGQEGNDVLNGGGGDDVILGNDGDDTIFGGDGNDLITGDLGFAPGNDSINAGAGNDTVLVQDGADTVLGGDGDDVVGIFAGTNLIVDGGAGSDVLIGGFDIFGATNATLEGGPGADLLVGGQFNDTFVYESDFGPSDLIYLFTPGTDKIRLAPNINGSGIATANDALTHASATTLAGIGPAVAITLGAEIIYVVGLQTLQASDFLIA